MAKGRCFELRPQACAIGDNEDNTARGSENAPDLTQQRTQGFGIFQKMRNYDAIDRAIGQRQRAFINEGAQVCGMQGPQACTLLGRHKGDNALSFGTEGPQIRRRIPQPQHGKPFDGRPDFTQAPANEARRNLAQMAFIKFLQFAGVQMHCQVTRCGRWRQFSFSNAKPSADASRPAAEI